MLIIPAVDLKDGCVVRLVRGNLDDAKIYSTDPLKTAKYWVNQGAQLLHIVDLDGASTGAAKNLDIVKRITKENPVPVQFGGGIRNIETIDLLCGFGVSRVILGTKAVEDKIFLKKAFKKFKSKVIVSIDAKDGKVLIKGWRQGYKNLDALALASALKDMGFTELIYTDVSKDGTLTGPNIKGIKALLKMTGMKVIASGGISSLKDISIIGRLEQEGVTGVIIGKALYEGKFTLKQALKTFGGETSEGYVPQDVRR